MNKSMLFLTVVLSLVTIIFLPSLSIGDSAQVLPNGVSRVGVQFKNYIPVDTRWDSSGNSERVSTDLDNILLNSDVVPVIADLEAAFSMTTGTGDIGRTVSDYDYEESSAGIAYHYGLTDKITIGVLVPYSWKKTKVDEASVDTSTATLGQNPAYGTTADPFGVPFIPIGLGGQRSDAFATTFVQSFLGTEFGLEPIETWSESGIGDVQAGLRYQYFSSEEWRLATTGYLVLPTGEVDDPDNLLDRSFGNGAMGLNIDFNNDYTGIDKLTLNATVGLSFNFVDKLVLRVPDDVNEPITTNKAKVKRDVSDEFYLELSADYSLSDTFGVNFLYMYLVGTGDKVTGNDPALDYGSLEDETDWMEQIYILGLSYSTVSLFMEKKAKIPMSVSFSYRDRFAGENVTDSSYFDLGLSVYF